MKKVLYSPGFGAGWSSWNSDGAKWAAEYQPIIDFLESGGEFVEKPSDRRDSYMAPWIDFEEPGASILKKFYEDGKKEFGDDWHFYLGGAESLRVTTVTGPYRIQDYDGNGNESVRIADPVEWW